MERALRLLLAIVLIASITACTPVEESPRRGRVIEPTPYSDQDTGADVTSEYLAGDRDLRKSPRGSVRSSIPDEIIVCDVEYYNSETGASSSYTLSVDFEDGRPRRINFPNGGWRSVFPIETSEGWEETDGSATYTILRPRD